MRIFWQDCMSVGIPAMDGDHRTMVALLDEVCLALQSRNLFAAGEALTRFAAAMAAHFIVEERLGDGFDQDNAEAHREVHDATRRQVALLQDAVTVRRDLTAARDLADEFVADWIKRLFREDRVLAANLRHAPAPIP